MGERRSCSVIEIVVRDPDSYEKDYIGLEEVELGYYCLGHIPPAVFLSRVLALRPNLKIDTAHHGWWGRWFERGHTLTGDWEPHVPTISDVVWTHWRIKRGNFQRSRPNTRGSFPVTFIPVEGSGELMERGNDLTHIWDASRQKWFSHFYPTLLER